MNRNAHTNGWLLALLLSLSLIVAACGEKQQANKQGTAAQSGDSRDSLTVSYDGQDSMTVFALLAESHQVDFVSSAMGVFVQGIDSVNNGSDIFWLFSVNDTMAKVSSDKYLTHTGDRVVWHFRRMSGGDQ